jgi:hypothetical protein
MDIYSAESKVMDEIDRLKAVEVAYGLLQAELDRYKWIPVSERLPEIGADFLVYDAFYEPREDFQCIRFGRMTKSWGISSQGANYAAPTITHWMPLPSPPVEVEK